MSPTNQLYLYKKFWYGSTKIYIVINVAINICELDDFS